MNESSTPIAAPHVEIYTDGGCEPNPGPGGYGAVLVHPRKRAEASGGFRRTTNNRMEIFAVIVGLQMLTRPCRVTIHSDSQYVVKAMMEGWVANWKRKGWWRTKTARPENVDLWQRLEALCQIHEVEFRWVKGHAGVQENERCDQLAEAALNQPNLPADEGYENKPEMDGTPTLFDPIAPHEPPPEGPLRRPAGERVVPTDREGPGEVAPSAVHGPVGTSSELVRGLHDPGGS